MRTTKNDRLRHTFFAILGTMRAWRAVALLWVAYLLNYVDRQVVFSIFPALVSELHFTGTELGLIGSVFLWVYSLSLPAAGRLADRVRRERLIVGSLLLWSLATLATGLSHSIGSFLFFRGLMGVTEALYFPAAASAIATLHPGPTRSRALSIHGSAQLVGIAIGGWYGGWTAEARGWRFGFTALAMTGVLYAPLLWLGLGKLGKAPTGKGVAASPRQIFASRCYWALSAAFFAFCLILWMLYAWLPNFIYEKYRLSLAGSGFTATVYLQAGSAAGILAGGALGDWAARRFAPGRFYVAALGLLASSPLAYAMLATDSLAALRVVSVGFGLFAGLVMANAVASAYELVAPANYGLAAGTLNTIGGLGGGLAAFFAGAWKESVGVEYLMAWGAASGVV